MSFLINLFGAGHRGARPLVWAMVTGVCLAFFLPAVGWATECGDYNGDGRINIGDVIFFVRCAFHPRPDCESIYLFDANCDGNLNIGDPIYLINYIFRNGPAPCAGCPQSRGTFLFEVSYSNFAWGARLQGFYIDASGNAFTYSYAPDDITYPPPLWYESFSEENLLLRYSHNPGYLATVSRDTLNAMYGLVEAASQGPISPPAVACFDFGILYFVAYIYDADSALYRPVLLQQAGDIAQTNISPEANILSEWLQTLGYEDPPCTYPE